MDTLVQRFFSRQENVVFTAHGLLKELSVKIHRQTLEDALL